MFCQWRLLGLQWHRCCSLQPWICNCVWNIFGSVTNWSGDPIGLSLLIIFLLLKRRSSEKPKPSLFQIWSWSGDIKLFWQDCCSYVRPTHIHCRIWIFGMTSYFEDGGDDVISLIKDAAICWLHTHMQHSKMKNFCEEGTPHRLYHNTLIGPYSRRLQCNSTVGIRLSQILAVNFD